MHLVQETGFYVKGPAKSLDIMKKYRLCVAPLRFGAGLKGKIVDSWEHGLPVVTTPIGSEGMTGLSLIQMLAVDDESFFDSMAIVRCRDG